MTTKYDLATMYGFNAESYDSEVLDEFQLNNLEILKGNVIVQKSFMDRKTVSLNGDFKSNGVIIGGCLDVLRYLFGTSYDNTTAFLEKYQQKKIIWYFDIYQMSSIDVYLTFLQMQNMGYFKYSDTIILGSVLYPNVECDMTYHMVYQKIFSKKNVIYDANIGHVRPSFTVINGSYVTVEYTKNIMSLTIKLLK